MNSSFIQIITTTPTTKLAEKIAKVLVEKKLAACVQIVGPAKSIYRWQGKVEQAKECLCFIKTTQSHFQKVEQVIKELHPYEYQKLFLWLFLMEIKII